MVIVQLVSLFVALLFLVLLVLMTVKNKEEGWLSNASAALESTVWLVAIGAVGAISAAGLLENGFTGS